MNIREQFGKYLLLKKLAEDPLGETFRAGRVGSHGMEQVVLLRAFNGTGIDGATLTASLQKRKAVHQALVSPNVGNGVDLGEVRGVPYIAYDYISGKDLAALQEQAKRRNHPIPSDHALLIAERVALALAVGYETRLDEERVLHGCLLPQLVMISNEGETRLLGFEAAPGLRQVMRSSVATRPLVRYLSPEARSGAALHKADDVYSLGAILLELLTGHPIASDSDLGAAIDQAELASEGMPLPDDLKKLLKQSLCPQAQRIGDVITWHKALSRMMFEGQYNPTTFNLAFFMHNLFRDDIEKESREVEAEKTMELNLPAPAPAPAAVAAAPAAAAAAAAAPAVKAPTFGASREHTATGVMSETQVRAQKQGKMKLVVGAIAALLVLGAGLGVFLAYRNKGAATTAAAQPASSGAVVPAADRGALQQQAVAEQQKAQQLEAAYQDMLAKQSKQLEEKYKAQMADEIDKMKKELEAQKQKAAQTQAAAAAAPAAAPTRKEAAPQPTTYAAAAPTRAIEHVAERPTDQRLASTQTAPASAPAPAAQAPAPATAPTQQVAAAPAAADPQTPTDVASAQGVSSSTPPRLVQRPSPIYPVMAQRMRKEATVIVRVLVDEAGRVSDTELKGTPAGFGFDQAALQAAKGARFQPAMQNGTAIKMWVDLPIHFKL